MGMVPAGELDEFNRNIVGEIEVIRELGNLPRMPRFCSKTD